VKEYTNSIVASRDTNISPTEVYDTLAKLRVATATTASQSNGIRALDVGAGAGVSTQVLWELGYREIDAVDWSGTAWHLNVEENGSCPPSVHFYELDDERFLKQWRQEINNRIKEINSHHHHHHHHRRNDMTRLFLILQTNRRKAVYFAKELLKDGGIDWLRSIHRMIIGSSKYTHSWIHPAKHYGLPMMSEHGVSCFNPTLRKIHARAYGAHPSMAFKSLKPPYDAIPHSATGSNSSSSLVLQYHTIE
jgi:SAM-dependent methyltransferase